MSKIQNDIDERFKPIVIKRSNLSHDYYAVNSIDGLILYAPGKRFKRRLIWLRMAPIFALIILNYQHFKWKMLGWKSQSLKNSG